MPWLLGGLLATPVAVVLLLAWLSTRPDLIARGVELAAGWPEGSVVLGDLELGRRVRVLGLVLHPPAERAPDVWIGAVEADWPEPWGLLDGVLDLGDVSVDGLRIAARTQSPGEGGERRSGGVELRASRVVVARGAYTAPEDAPLQAVELVAIDAAFRDVRWRPRERSIEGVGRASIGRMDLGALELEAVDAPAVTLAEGDLRLGPTSFRYGRTEAFAQGEITHLDARPAVRIDVRLAGARVEHAVTDATGRPSPLMGWLTSQVTVEAGGELPRGGSRITGWVQLTDTQVFAGESMKLIPKVLLDLAPWFQREDGGWVSVGNLRGEASFGRGWVELERLERPSDKNRVLQAWGRLRDGEVDVTVRAVPKRDEDKAGIGVRLLGPVGNAKLSLAKRDHLLTAPEVASAD